MDIQASILALLLPLAGVALSMLLLSLVAVLVGRLAHALLQRWQARGTPTREAEPGSASGRWDRRARGAGTALARGSVGILIWLVGLPTLLIVLWCLGTAVWK